MPVNQTTSDTNMQLLRVRARTAPLCYSRQETQDEIDRSRIDTQTNATLAVLGAVTSAATFLVVYGGWGF
jgi:hypothetical protein